MLTTIAITACGVPLAFLWWLVAPKLGVVADGDGLLIIDPQPEQYVGSDVAFLACASLVAVAAFVGVWLLLRRYRGPLMLVALTAGLLGCYWVAWKLGEELGSSQVKDLTKNASMGEHLNVRVVQLRLTGFLFAPALIAVIGYALLSAVDHAPDLSDTRTESGPTAGSIQPISKA